MHPSPLPAVGASWLNLIEGWWRIFRRKAFAGQDFANHQDLAVATRLATHQLNARARPWIREAPTSTTPHAPSPVPILPLTNDALGRMTKVFGPNSGS